MVHYHQVRDAGAACARRTGADRGCARRCGDASRAHRSTRPCLRRIFDNAILLCTSAARQFRYRFAARTQRWVQTRVRPEWGRANESACKGTRALDGGDSRLHPQNHCRRRRRESSAEGERAGPLPRPAPLPPVAPAPRMAAPPPPPPPEPAKPQDDIDAMLAQLRAVHAAAPPRPPAPEEEPDADILDLTESMAALDARRRASAPSTRSRTSCSTRSAGASGRRELRNRSGRRYREPDARRAHFVGDHGGGRFRLQLRWPRPCWCRTPARSRIWCGKCCGRCSSPGSTTICRAWSSGWCAPRSSASRAAATDRRSMSKRNSSAGAAARARTTTPAPAALRRSRGTAARRRSGRRPARTAATPTVWPR